MRKLFFLISAIIIVSSSHFAAAAADDPMGYQWWFDNDVSTISHGTFESESFEIDIDTSDLPRGTHYFNCRLVSAEGVPGSAYRRMILVASGNTAASEFEYWIDNNYDSRTHGNVTTGENQYLINLDDVRPGLHRFNYRLRFSDGSWGAVSTNYFYLTPGNSTSAEYEYWIDNDYSSRKTAEVSGSPIVFDVDLADASSGLHSFNCRLRDGGDTWGAVSTIYFYIAKENIRIDEYEYWLDNDYESRRKIKADSNIMTFDVNLDGISKGFHRFNCRLSNRAGACGTVSSTYFYLGSENSYIAEYWVDNDYSTRKTVEASGKLITLDFDMDGIDTLIGLHSLNCRLQSDDGTWGAVSTTYFTITPADILVAEYEYWLDNDYLSRKTDKVSGSIMTFDIDLDSLERNSEIHRFNYRLRSGSGAWGAIATTYFGLVHDPIGITDYEYWIDNDYHTRKTGKVTGELMTFDVNLDSNASGLHRFNYRLRNSNGIWGAVSSTYYYIASDKSHVIMGYRHYINDLDLGYVAIEGTPADTYAFEVEIPEELGLNIRNKQPIFDGNTVTIGGTDSIRYSMQIQTESGWLQPSSWDVVASNSFSTTAVEMRVNSHCTLETPGAGKFVAVKFTASGQPLYFLSNIPLTLDLYKDGEMVTEVSATELTEITMLELPPGEYFGILHDAQSNNTDFILRIMDTPDAIPSPQISYDDGLVSISCSRDDAEIYYTLDQSMPTIESLLYQEPFTIDRSTVVKAIAFVPDSDLEPSAVSELEIILQSGSVTISYNGRYVSIEADADDARIYYSLDSSVDEPDNEYQGRFDAHGLATVRAFAVRDGFSNSEIVEYNIFGYADETHAETATGGILASCYEWTGRDMLDNLDNLRLVGHLNNADFSFIRTLSTLHHLDLQDVASAQIPDGAMSGLPLVTIVMPADIASIGDRVFDTSGKLCAVIWNDPSLKAEARIFGGETNPNLLLYLPYSDSDESGIANRIVSGIASSIVLTDAYPFFAPIDFHAQSITYTRNFSKETLIGSCSGWETLTLPFDVERIADSVGEAVPFTKATPQDRPFWLYWPNGNGWESTDAIRAYRPYLISMPNNPEYTEYYNIRGDVTFSATDVNIAITPNSEGYPYKNGATLWPVYGATPITDNIWVINDDWFENDIPGSVFVEDLRAVRPFECYMISDCKARRIPVFDAGVTGIEELKTNSHIKIWTEGHEICILSDVTRRINVFDIAGHVVRTVDVVSGTVQRIQNLPTGLYLIANRKVFLY